MFVGPPAAIGPEEVPGSNSRFDAWELAAMNIGAAASKSTPLTIDAVEYYNRIIGFPPAADPEAVPPVPDYISPWGATFVRSADPDDPTTELAGSERFVNYSGFTYNRSETFKGSVTWLDVAALQWKVSKIVDIVPFTNLSGLPAIGNNTLTGIVGFAQLADDVRAMSNFVPDNTFIPGFYMDVPGVDTTLDQLAAITDPAVDLGTLPLDVFQTFPFQVTMSLLNPWGGWTLDDPPVWWGGERILDARLRITIDAADDFVDGDVAAMSVGTPSYAVPFTVDNGDLVGFWGPEIGFEVPPGYNVSTTFDVTIADTAPRGDYGITLDLVTASDPDPEKPLAAESGFITVHENELWSLWGDPLPKLATQGGAVHPAARGVRPGGRHGRIDAEHHGAGRGGPRRRRREGLRRHRDGHGGHDARPR